MRFAATTALRPRVSPWLFMSAALLCASAHLAEAKDCNGNGTQADMNICERKNLENADARLNAAYNKLAAKVSAAGKAKLVDAQRAWIKYRDLQCDFESMGTNGGSIHSMIVGQCLTEMTAAQTKRLERQLNCEEGDTSCGGQ
jgi:uncharacterized protein YecT (DUF1311 family)